MTAFWRKKKLLEVVPMSASTLWRKIKAGEFPAPILISDNIPAWDAEIVTNWLANRQTVSPENTKPVCVGGKKGRKPKIVDKEIKQIESTKISNDEAIIAKHLEGVPFKDISTQVGVSEYDVSRCIKINTSKFKNGGFTLNSNALDFAEIMLSVRGANCLKNWLVHYPLTIVTQIDLTPDSQLLKTQNFGKKSLKEVRDKIQAMKDDMIIPIKHRIELDRDLITSDKQFPKQAKFYAEWEE